MEDGRDIRRISLVIAGAVSLGAYEGGSLTELIYLLEYLNGEESPGVWRNKEYRYVIDVITGGSAGSITGALVARVLLHDINRTDILKKGWVDKVNFKNLKDTKNQYPGALFKTDDAQDRLKRLYLLGLPPDREEDQGEDFPLQVVQRASCAPPEGDSLHLGFSVTNLAGVDYQVPFKNLETEGQAGLIQTYFSFFDEYEINSETLTDSKYWDKLGDSAIASGSFPLTFTPKIIKRKFKDYSNIDPAINDYLSEDGEKIDHFDGGMLRNEPLKKAMQLSSKVDGGFINENRIFILIDPNVNTSKQKSQFTHLKSKPHNIVTNALRCVTAIMGEATNEEWTHIEKINKQIEWMQGIATDYVALANNLNGDVLEQAKAEALAKTEVILREKSEIVTSKLGSDGKPILLSADSNDYLGKSFKHIASTFNTQLNLLRTDRNDEELKNAKSLLEHKIFNLLSASNLNRKSPIDLWIVGANDDEVGGNPVAAMLGFFKHDIRDHDYRVGRTATHKVLLKIFSKDISQGYPREGDTEVPGTLNPEYDIPPNMVSLKKSTFDDVSLRDQRTLKTLVKNELNYARKSLDVGVARGVLWIIIGIISSFVDIYFALLAAKKGGAWTWGKVKWLGSKLKNIFK